MIQVSISYTSYYISLTLPPKDPSHAPAHPKNMLLKKTSNQPGIGGLSPGEIGWQDPSSVQPKQLCGYICCISTIFQCVSRISVKLVHLNGDILILHVLNHWNRHPKRVESKKFCPARPSDSSILLNSARSVFGSQKFWRKAQLAACYVCSGLDWFKLVLDICLHLLLIHVDSV